MEMMNKQPITIQEYRERLKKRTCKTDELAEILGISLAKARRLVRIEGFPVLKVGRNNLVILSKLDEWLEENIGQVL
ncbi:helix-turn-helix domain-containing protein [Clostridium culturomicium]|uniref:helix-turn-helix domain-containing protein n=1 Tax=Clostridium culturomicium TaxID=1499683 RepID=UPI0038573970